jgi:hypothetical protein
MKTEMQRQEKKNNSSQEVFAATKKADRVSHLSRKEKCHQNIRKANSWK